MTEITKELITTTKRSGLSYSDESAPTRAQDRRFKECMQAIKEKEEHADEELSEDTENLASGVTPFSLSFQSAAIPTASVMAAASVQSTSLEIEALFEKMAATMLVMTSTDERETTLFLDSPKFSSSTLFGTRITIKEFSTAPKVFNIEIASHHAALQLLSSHKDALMAAFENHKLPFSVHRLDTELHSLEESSLSQSDQGDAHDRTKDESS